MAAAAKIRIAAHVEVSWLDADAAADAVCPNCSYQGKVRRYLDIDYRPPEAVHRFVLQICPRCNARFADNPETMDYATEQLIEIGWHVYQTQIGAGVWPIAAPLTRLDKPAGARVLEIGGAYGFGLDFCIRARGWQGEGFDPSPLAEYGARELGLTIAQDYFEDKDLARGPYDVIIATEVIEHLPHPPDFLTLMRRAVADDGIVVLSTPDAAWITPDLGAELLMPLLSPGAHVVLQTEQSLRTVLTEAGFPHVTVVRSTTTLTAYASPSPFVLNTDAAAGRAMYRRYLVERSKLATPGSDLSLGFAGRGLFEAANDADLAASAGAWATLVPAVQARFGFDLAALQTLPMGAESADLATLARLIPLGLGMILFGRAMQQSTAGIPRHEMLPIFRLAAAAAAALQNALAQRSLGDGLSASILRNVQGEIALCEAEAGAPSAVQQLIAWIAQNPSAVMPWRGFVGLVNAGAVEQAAELQTTLHLHWPDPVLPEDLRRDALLSLANFALAPGGDTARTFDYALALRDMGEPGATTDRIILEGFTRLVNAGNYAAAEAALTAHGIEALAAQSPSKAGEDANQAMVMLDLGLGRTVAAIDRLTPLLTAPAQNPTLNQLCVDGFVRLVNESRFAEARRLALDYQVENRLEACPPSLSRDALAAALLLELQPGGELGLIPGRIEALDRAKLDEDRLRDLTFAAFVTVVNANDMDLAKTIQPLLVSGIAKLRTPFDPAARDALFAYGVFSTTENSTKSALIRGAATFAKLRDDLVKRTAPGAAPDGLFWPALRGEIAALMQLGRSDEATTLLTAFVPEFAGAPDDLRAMMPATAP